MKPLYFMDQTLEYCVPKAWFCAHHYERQNNIIYKCVCVFVYVEYVSCASIYVSLCMQLCAHTHTHTHTHIYIYIYGDRGSTVVKVLCYKSESRWFDPSRCQWILRNIKSFRSHYSPDVDSASNRNEYQEHFLGVRLTTLPPSCAVVMKSGNLNFLELSGPLQACNGTDLPLYIYIYI